jgi:hypothetical protein
MKIASTLAGLVLAGLTSQAGIFTFTATLTGADEVPPNASIGSGNATAIFDSTLNEFSIAGTFGGLASSATAAHVHTGPAGVAGPVFLPLVVTHATTGTVVGSTTGLNKFQIHDLLFGNWYVNVHDVNFPGGEIRGQLILASVPEPETYAAIAGAGLLGFAAWRRFRA